MFYTSFIERATDPSSHIMPNENKGYIAKDPSFLRKLEILLQDPGSSREWFRFIWSQIRSLILVTFSTRNWKICPPALCTSVSTLFGATESLPCDVNIFYSGYKYNWYGKLFWRGLPGEFVNVWLFSALQRKNQFSPPQDRWSFLSQVHKITRVFHLARDEDEVTNRGSQQTCDPC